MMKEDLFVSVVIPVRGEEASWSESLQELSAVLSTNYNNYEIILIDDHHAPCAYEMIQKALNSIDCLRIIRLSRHFSFDIAATAGLESAIGDYIVILDLRVDPPRLIPEMIVKAGKGVGLVVGVNKQPNAKGWLRKALASYFHWYVKRYLGVDLIPNSTQYRVLSRRVVNAIIGIKGKYRQLRFLTSMVGYGSAMILYQPKYNINTPFLSLVSEACDLLIANSTHPLRIVSFFGLFASGLNLLYLCYVVIIYVIKQNVSPGWTTLSLQTGGMFFLVFFLLTVLCEYIGRILAETRSQPLYHIWDELNSSVLVKNVEQRRNVVEASK